MAGSVEGFVVAFMTSTTLAEVKARTGLTDLGILRRLLWLEERDIYLDNKSLPLEAVVPLLLESLIEARVVEVRVQRFALIGRG